MKILYLCNYYHRAMIFRDSMDYLEKRGHEVLAFNAVVQGATVSEKYSAIMDEKVVHSECFNYIDRYNYFRKQRKIKNALVSAINVQEFDIMHSHTMFNGGWVAREIYRKFGVPYVVSVRNTDLNDYLKIPVFKIIAKKIAKDAKYIQFLSETYRDSFIQKCFRNDPQQIYSKSCVITNGLEPFWLDHKIEIPKQIGSNQIKLLCVGKIDRNKNMKAVLEAMKLLNEKGYCVKTCIIGQVVDQEIEKMIHSYENVEIVGYMTKEKLIHKYREADIYVMPSFTESFGRVYAEAMTQGLPVIYTRGQGFDGQFPEGYVGYSVSPQDYSEIASKIEAIYYNYAEISSNCIRESDRFDWNRITLSIDEMYQKAISGGDK